MLSVRLLFLDGFMLPGGMARRMHNHQLGEHVFLIQNYVRLDPCQLEEKITK